MPCHSCHIYGISSSRSKKVQGMLKRHQLWVAIQVTERGTLLIGKGGSHYVILLYCETLLQVLLDIYCKRFYWIPLFTILLLFYVFEVGKAKSATPSVLMILTLNGLFQKNFQTLGFYFTPENAISLTLPHPFPPVCFFPLLQCTVISDCNHPLDTSTFTHSYSITRAHYCN